MNNDLISREALKKTMLNYIDCEKCTHKDTNYCADLCAAYDFLVMLEEAPTVEPEKVVVANVTFDKDELDQIVRDRIIELFKNGELVIKDERPHGKWLEDSGNIACSHCHTIWLYRRTDFCPNCGADMRGEDHD